MTHPPTPSELEATPFSLGLDGTVSGSPDHPLLPPSLRYVARLAAGLSPDLGLGRLTGISTHGTYAVRARVSWDVGGDCSVRGQLWSRPTPPTTLTPPMTRPGADGDEVVGACLSSVRALTGLDWALVVRGDRRVLASLGSPPASGATPEEVAVRARGFLAGIEAGHRETGIWLQHTERTLVVAPTGQDCLVLCLHAGEGLDEGADEASQVLVETLLAVRSTLATTDLSGLAPRTSPWSGAVSIEEELADLAGSAGDTGNAGDTGSAGDTDHAGEDVWDDDWEPDDAVPLTGARFAGAVSTPPRRRREGR